MSFEEWSALGLRASAHQRFQRGCYDRFAADGTAIRAILREGFGAVTIGFADSPAEASPLAVALRLMNPAPEPQRTTP